MDVVARKISTTTAVNLPVDNLLSYIFGEKQTSTEGRSIINSGLTDKYKEPCGLVKSTVAFHGDGHREIRLITKADS